MIYITLIFLIIIFLVYFKENLELNIFNYIFYTCICIYFNILLLLCYIYIINLNLFYLTLYQLNFVSNLIYISKFIFFIILLIFIIYFIFLFIIKKQLFFEIFLLLKLSLFGSLLLLFSNDFITFYLSIELQSIPIYVLIVIFKKNSGAIEASLKYFIVNAIGSSILLLGISYLYYFFGSIYYKDINLLLLSLDYLKLNNFFYFGLFFLFLGILLKLAIVPFHL